MFEFIAWIALLPMNTPVERASGRPEEWRSVVGLLRLPEVFGPAESCQPPPGSDPIPLFPRPEGVQAGRLFPTQADAAGCSEVQVDLPGADDRPLPVSEVGYEEEAAIVVDARPPWFRIATSVNEYHWVRVPDTALEWEQARFQPIEALLIDGLPYLTSDVLDLYSNPTTTSAEQVLPVDRHIPISVLESRRVDDRIWLRVEIGGEPACGQQWEGPAPVHGWIPLHDANGLPVVWFSSRGC